ncbi:dynein beta chain, ciliary-like [Octopus sinensis]|uniref:Dynein beta chain, ciliary-like n=1 Tax=Octopus sinensis TaxID=2607531 RepID=A0A7E6EJ64_9MOLL|nr:dynein beta chain, ciliary-like [Octopus sinensis]
MLDKEIDDVKHIFDENVKKEASGTICLNHKNIPLVSGALKWAEELKQRISEPMSDFNRLENPYSETVYGKWFSEVGEICSFNLKQPILTRNEENSLLSVNFDPQVGLSAHIQLAAVLKEVKYLQLANKEDIPAKAFELFEKGETLREYLNNLNLTVALYNKIREQVLEIEMSLIENEMNSFDQQIKAAETSLNWDSPGHHFPVIC